MVLQRESEIHKKRVENASKDRHSTEGNWRGKKWWNKYKNTKVWWEMVGM